MALAIQFERWLREGEVADQSALARLVHVSQPRLTQIMNLNHLAPNIQEVLLHLPLTTTGREAIHERVLRSVAAVVSWREQRALWRAMQERAEAIGSGRSSGASVTRRDPPRG